MGDEFNLTGEELARMEMQAFHRDLSEVLDLIDELLVMWQYYQRTIGPDEMKKVRAELNRVMRDYN